MKDHGPQVLGAIVSSKGESEVEAIEMAIRNLLMIVGRVPRRSCAVTEYAVIRNICC